MFFKLDSNDFFNENQIKPSTHTLGIFVIWGRHNYSGPLKA